MESRPHSEKLALGCGLAASYPARQVLTCTSAIRVVNGPHGICACLGSMGTHHRVSTTSNPNSE